MDLPIMSESSMDAVIQTPFETVDLIERVFGLTDEEYWPQKSPSVTHQDVDPE